jgi:glycolate oxidase
MTVPAASRATLQARLREFLPEHCLIDDRESQRPFECDGLSLYRELPVLVALPETVEQVRRLLKVCRELDVPVVPRGSGTGLCAGAMPHPEGLLLGLSKLDRILDIDPLAGTARVEPGVSNLSISEAASTHGLYYAPDPSSQIACSIGGNVAENSGGVHCLKYGLTVHNVLGLKVLTAEGELVSVGGLGLDSPGYDLLALFNGSEGLLGVVVEITVRLLPCPQLARVVMAGFDSVKAAGDAVGAVIAAGIIPAGLEMMDRLAIRAAEDFAAAGYPRDAEALLLCEVDGTREEVDQHSDRISALFREMGASSITVSNSDEERGTGLLLYGWHHPPQPGIPRAGRNFPALR